jgi:hypothetical protein
MEEWSTYKSKAYLNSVFLGLSNDDFPISLIAHHQMAE